jgi:hypothetical protein
MALDAKFRATERKSVMKLLTSAAIAAILTSLTPAQAVEPLPAEMLGAWCYAGAKERDHTYVRAKTARIPVS